MIEFIKEIVTGIVSFFTAGVMTVAGVISSTPTPTPMPSPISTSTEEVSAQNSTVTNLPTITQTPVPITFLTAKGQFSYKEKKVNIELSMPENGGKLTGSIKGLCNGTVEGTYQKENSAITGAISGECSAIACCGTDSSEYYKSSGEFNGEVNLVEKVIRTKSKGRIYPPYFRNGAYITVGEMDLTLNIQ